MPTYEYACDNCGHTFEAEQRIVADPLKVCPACNQESLRRLITQGNFILKGSGWYADLYSGPSNQGKGGPSKPSGDSAAASSAAASSPSAASTGSGSSSSGSESTSAPAKSDSTAASKPSTAPAKP